MRKIVESEKSEQHSGNEMNEREMKHGEDESHDARNSVNEFLIEILIF